METRYQSRSDAAKKRKGRKEYVEWYHRANLHVCAVYHLGKNLQPEPNYFELNLVTFITTWARVGVWINYRPIAASSRSFCRRASRINSASRSSCARLSTDGSVKEKMPGKDC